MLFKDDVVLLASPAQTHVVHTSKFEAVGLSDGIGWSTKVEEFKYHRVLFKSRKRVEEDTDRRKAWLSICWLIYITSLICGHELWVVIG